MPNGRSGGFIARIEDLRGLLGTHARAGVVAEVLSGRHFTQSTAAHVSSLLAGCEREQVAVEEQHGDRYIIHLGADPVVWVCVGPQSPLFADLRERHARFASEHPNWTGWIAF